MQIIKHRSVSQPTAVGAHILRNNIVRHDLAHGRAQALPHSQFKIIPSERGCIHN